MAHPDLEQLWSTFLDIWAPELLLTMSVSEYTNLDRDDSLTYWLESRLEPLGSIWGGSAFKFGIYHQSDIKIKAPAGGRVWTDPYAWLTKFGATADEAFATIHGRLIQVLDAIQAGDLARVEAIDLPPTLKWKIAFLYQDRQHPVLFPIFSKAALFHHYRRIVPNARMASTPFDVMYAALLERHRDAGDIFDVAETLWRDFSDAQERAPRAWLFPLVSPLPDEDQGLLQKTHVDAEAVPPLLEQFLSSSEAAAGDHLALVVDGRVRALAALTIAEPGQQAWEQRLVDFVSNVPASTPRELSVEEWHALWGRLPAAEQAELPGWVGTRYWKIAPGAGGALWTEWQARGIATIGWPALGDISGMTRAQFDDAMTRSAAEHGYKSGANQVWTFSQIRPGDRVIANRGKQQILGIGTVTGGYRFNGQTLHDGPEDHPHQIQVRWDETIPRRVHEGAWQRTLIELSATEFARLAGSPEAPPAEPAPQPAPALPCVPRNVILYGPPGTGKTYSTVRRALELILGRQTLESMSEKTMMAIFREHQARGQIEFVTFHQAYGYEEFVEGIRPVLGAAGSAASDVRYELHDGVFKRIALRASAEGLRLDSTEPDFDTLWTMLLQELATEDSIAVFGQRGNEYLLEATSRGNIAVRPFKTTPDGEGEAGAVMHTASKENARLYWDNRLELGPDPSDVTVDKATALFRRVKGSGGGHPYTALWLTYGELVRLKEAFSTRAPDPADRLARVQSALDKPGPTTTFSFSARTPQYVLIVDEINRGNMSKILGELITLLEPDKRLTGRNELKLPLTYSPQHRFGVPPNLHVVGTMNTADRSIALMDVALRRRFTFEELMPDAEVIRIALQERAVAPALAALVIDLFVTINARVRFLYDRDHQLGHSYFLEIDDHDALRLVFVDRLIPMLQEYFYGAWDKVCLVLGCPYDDRGLPTRQAAHLVATSGGRRSYRQPLIAASVFEEMQAIGLDHDEYEDRVDHRVSADFQRGTLSRAQLFDACLGILTLDADTHEQRLHALTMEAAQDGPTDPPATGSGA